MNFKAGDRVIINNYEYTHFSLNGQTGTVNYFKPTKDDPNNRGYWRVNLDNGINDFPFLESELRLIDLTIFGELGD